jgi:hypothetical protein
VGRDWLANDPNKLAEGIVGALDATAAELIAELRGFTRVFDPARCEPRYLPYLARKLGWDLDTSRSTIRTAAGGETVMTLSFRYTPGHDPPEVWVNGRPAAFTESSPSTITLAAPLAAGDRFVAVDRLQRKVVQLLAPLYRLKGTIPGIVGVLRLFLGVEARARAAWAGGWRLGRDHLGAQLLRVVATGGETAIALPWTYTPGHRALTVRLNGTDLAAGAYTEATSTTLILATPLAPGDVLLVFDTESGVTRLAAEASWSTVARQNQTIVPVPFPVSDPLDLHVTVDGVPRSFTNADWSFSGGRVVFATPLAEGQVVAIAHARHALTLFVEVPRVLTDAERTLALFLLDRWKPSLAIVRLLEPEAPGGSPWRLGYAQLGRPGEGYYRYEVTAVGGETLIPLPYAYRPHDGRLVVSVNGPPTAFTESSPSTITLAAPLAPGDALVVVYCGETRL